METFPKVKRSRDSVLNAAIDGVGETDQITYPIGPKVDRTVSPHSLSSPISAIDMVEDSTVMMVSSLTNVQISGGNLEINYKTRTLSLNAAGVVIGVSGSETAASAITIGISSCP